MYQKPLLTKLTAEQLTELLGPVETQYTGNNIAAQCGGCDVLNVVQSQGTITRLTVTAPDCNGQTTAFRLTAQPAGQLPGVNIQPQVITIPVQDGSFVDDVWTYTTPIGLLFTGTVSISVDVLSNQGSTGPLCQTTTTVSMR